MSCLLNASDDFDDSESEPDVPFRKRFRLSSSQIDNILEDDTSRTPSQTRTPSTASQTRTPSRKKASASSQSARKAKLGSYSSKTPTRKQLESDLSDTGSLSDDNGAGGGPNLENEGTLQLPLAVTQALNKFTSVLNTVVNRMDNMEKTLQNWSPTSLTSSCEIARKSKKSVPLVVRVS